MSFTASVKAQLSNSCFEASTWQENLKVNLCLDTKVATVYSWHRWKITSVLENSFSFYDFFWTKFLVNIMVCPVYFGFFSIDLNFLQWWSISDSGSASGPRSEKAKMAAGSGRKITSVSGQTPEEDGPVRWYDGRRIVEEDSSRPPLCQSRYHHCEFFFLMRLKLLKMGRNLDPKSKRLNFFLI